MLKKFVSTIALLASTTTLQADCINNSCSNECGNFTVNAEYLYWWTCTDGLAIALQIDTDRSTLNFVLPLITVQSVFRDNTTEKMISPSTDGDSGFRVGISYESCDNTTFVNWTRFHPDLKKNVAVDFTFPNPPRYFVPFSGYALESILSPQLQLGFVGITNDPILIPESGFPIANSVKGRWKLELDIIDIGRGKTLQLGQCLTLKPHLGLRYASIDQKLTVDSTGVIALNLPESQTEIVSETNVNPFDSFQYQSHFKNDFQGLGPRIGFDIEYELGCQVGLFGNIATSLLYGDRQSSVRDSAEIHTVFPFEDNLDDFSFSRKVDMHCVRPIIDLTLGLSWEHQTCYSNCDLDLGLTLGWEYHYFFGQGIAEGSRNSQYFAEEHRDLSTQGVTVGLFVGF